MDDWHEAVHPDRWSKNFYFEAEVQDGNEPLKIFTETKKAMPGDFTDFISYVQLSDNNKISFDFVCKNDSASQKYISFRWKSKMANVISVKLNEKEIRELKLKEGQDQWQWCTIEVTNGSIKKNNILSLQCSKGIVNIDKVLITKDKDFIQKGE